MLYRIPMIGLYQYFHLYALNIKNGPIVPVEYGEFFEVFIDAWYKLPYTPLEVRTSGYHYFTSLGWKRFGHKVHAEIESMLMRPIPVVKRQRILDSDKGGTILYEDKFQVVIALEKYTVLKQRTSEMYAPIF